jgi:hypothetical protein
LPKGTLGIIGIAVSPVKNDRVFALIEAENGGVFEVMTAAKRGKRPMTREAFASVPGIIPEFMPTPKMRMWCM